MNKLIPFICLESLSKYRTFLQKGEKEELRGKKGGRGGKGQKGGKEGGTREKRREGLGGGKRGKGGKRVGGGSSALLGEKRETAFCEGEAFCFPVLVLINTTKTRQAPITKQNKQTFF